MIPVKPDVYMQVASSNGKQIDGAYHEDNVECLYNGCQSCSFHSTYGGTSNSNESCFQIRDF